MVKKTVLVLNGSSYEENIIRIFKDMGLYVITSKSGATGDGVLPEPLSITSVSISILSVTGDLYALLFMIPAANDEGKVKTVTEIKKELKILQNELKQFNPELLDKKWMLAITKCDLISEKESAALETNLAKYFTVLCISAVTNWKLTELKDRLWDMLQS